MKSDLIGALGVVFRAWVSDEESDVVAAELVEDRWAVRVRQRTRDFTTVWVHPGDRTAGFEAYVLPPPPNNRAEVYRQVLFRNHSAWRVHFSIDPDGAIYLRGRVDATDATEETLGYVFGEIYQLVELSFRPLLKAGYQR